MHDIGIQCCCHPVSLRTTAVQTEDLCYVNKDNAHVFLPAQNKSYHVPSSVDAKEWRVLKDHSYSLPAHSLSVVFPIIFAPVLGKNFHIICYSIYYASLHQENAIM